MIHSINLAFLSTSKWYNSGHNMPYLAISLPFHLQDFPLAREKCRAASLGATGHALIAALSLEAEACHALGDADAAAELLRRVLSSEAELHGAESADCCALEMSGKEGGWLRYFLLGGVEHVLFFHIFGNNHSS